MHVSEVGRKGAVLTAHQAMWPEYHWSIPSGADLEIAGTAGTDGTDA